MPDNKSSKPLLSTEARRDLKDIQKFIAEEQERPKAALKVIESILDRIEKLIKYPNIGILLSPKVNFPTNYRYARASGYLIFYRNENKKINVDRIIHSKRDYISILFPELSEEYLATAEKARLSGAKDLSIEKFKRNMTEAIVKGAKKSK